MAPGKGKKGSKRKYEDGEKGNAKKPKQMQANLYGPSTSSGITHEDDPAQEKMGKRDWFRHCKIDMINVKPKCTICNEHHSFYIEPRIFKQHLETEHPQIHIIEDKPDWIFHYFKFIIRTQNLKCKHCNLKLKVSKFIGEFVDHFVNDDGHNYGPLDETNYEILKESDFMISLLTYLFNVYLNKENIKRLNDARLKAWWMRCVRKVERNRVFCIINDCPLTDSSAVVRLRQNNFEDHIEIHLQEQNLTRSSDDWEYFLFEDYVLKCKFCDKPYFYYTFRTNFRRHLKEQHRITQEEQGGESSQETNEENIKEHFTELLKYIITNKIYE